MLGIRFDDFVTNKLMVWVNGNKWRFNRSVWRLENHRTRLYPLKMTADMIGNVLKPILRPARVA